jgi:hypothetical protein
MIAAIYAPQEHREAHVDEDAKSCSRQIGNAKAFIGSKGWILGSIFKDDGISGAETRRLRDKQRLLEMIRAGRHLYGRFAPFADASATTPDDCSACGRCLVMFGCLVLTVFVSGGGLYMS